MGVKIQSDNSSDEIRVDANKAAYVTLRDSAGLAMDASTKSILVAEVRKATFYGTYYLHSGNYTLQNNTNQNGTTTAIMWFIQEDGAKLCRIKKIAIRSCCTAATSFVTAPRIIVTRVTFTSGPASGAQITPAKRDSTDTAPSATIRTASTGVTFSLDQPFMSHIVPAVMSGVGIGVQDTTEWVPKNDDEAMIIRDNEGIAFYQIDSSSASDTRKAIVDIVWEEYV